MMIGIAAVAVLLATGLEVERHRRRLQFKESAAGNGENARRMRINAMVFEERAARKGSHPINKRMADESRKWATFFDRAREQWIRAAERQWPSLSPEDFTSNPEPPPIPQSEFPDVQFGKPFPL
jgi:hypothetical protein